VGQPPASRPRHRSELTLKRIIGAAILEFGTNGITNTTFDAIAERAGVSKQLIYHYYANKDELYIDASEALSREIHRQYFEIDFSAMEPRAALVRLFNLMFELSRNNDYNFTADEISRAGEHLKPRGESAQSGRRLIALLQEILDHGAEAGVFRSGLDAHKIYLTAFLLVPGFMSARAMASRYLQTDFSSPAAIEAWRQHVLDLISDMVSLRGPPAS
jgi:TetR/AcrR family transcriptional regulator